MTEPIITDLIDHKEIIPFINKDNLFQFIHQHSSIYRASNDFLQVNFFKDGIRYKNFDIEKLLKCEEYEEIPCSIRITNIHLLIPEIHQVCLKLEKKFNRTFTCNLYMTPGLERNCFITHVDDQITYVTQIHGEKKWSWPMKDGKPFHFVGAQFFSEEMTKDLEFKSLNIKAGEHLLVPFGTPHKVEISGDEPSLHLTFASQENLWRDCFQEYLYFNIEKANLGHLLKESITESQFENNFRSALNEMNKVPPQDFIDSYKKKIFIKSLTTLKKGRSYAALNGRNND